MNAWKISQKRISVEAAVAMSVVRMFSQGAKKGKYPG